MWVIQSHAAREEEVPDLRIDLVLGLENGDAENKGEDELVLFKNRATDVPVNGAREVVVEVLDSKGQVLRGSAVGNGGEVEIDEPGEGVLVHGVNVRKLRDAEEEG